MCTAIRFNERFFGRTLDFERSFGEELVIAPRGCMRLLESQNRYAIMGVGLIQGDTPLYFDGVNEWGLAAAALNFPAYAVYRGTGEGSSIPSGELISLVLGLCRSTEEAREMLGKIDIGAEGSAGLRPSPLHWIIADEAGVLVVESVADGLRLYDNPIGVLTNSPDLPYHLTRLGDYSGLSSSNPDSGLGGSLLYSRGMGAIGLPGDFSSSSRFVRAAFLKENALFSKGEDKEGDIGIAFDIMANLSIPKGAVRNGEGQPVYTRYTAVIDMDSPSYHLTTSACRAVSSIALGDELMNGSRLCSISIK